MTDTNKSSTDSDGEESRQTSLSNLTDGETDDTVNTTSADGVSLAEAEASDTTDADSPFETDESTQTADSELDDWNDGESQDEEEASEASDPSTQSQVLDGAKTGLITVGSFVTAVLLGFGRRVYHLAMGHTDKKSGLSGRFFPEDKISGSEEILFADTPSRWRAVGPYTLGALFFLTAILTPIAVYSGAYVSYFSPRSPAIISIHQPTYWWVFSLLCIFFGVLAIVGEMVDRAATWMIVTDHQIIKRWGVFASDSEDFRIDDTQKLGTSRKFQEKIVGIGEIEASTPGDEGDEIRFKYIKHPKRRQNIIREQRSFRKGDIDNKGTPESQSNNS